MSHELSRALREQFGFEEFRPGQREVIESLMAGHSAVAVFPTGSGKSLCYQLPALLLDGVTLVVSPLIALMKDQVDALQARGIPAKRLDSTLSADEHRDLMSELRSGQLRLLFVAPERFNNERFRQSIVPMRISLFAIDEAHCISEWGHNFRPDYLKLVEFSKLCRAERVLALTATATEQVLADVRKAFNVSQEHVICTGFYRNNLTLQATPIASGDRDELLINRLKSRDPGPTIIYVTLQKTAEMVAGRLTAKGFPAKAYHAGLLAEHRSAVQDGFLDSKNGIVVATIAFGMGVDKSNVRYVYHYNLPKSLENYAQEIGRSGRDGLASICETLICLDDLNVLENFAYGDTPTPSAVRSLVRDTFSRGADFDVSYYDLSAKHDVRVLVVRTLLTYLELEGYLEGGTPFYSQYQFQPLMPSAKILENFQGERREFLANVFRQSTKARTWFSLDVDQAAFALGVPRDRIVRALDYLGERKMLEVKVQGVRNRYRRLKSCVEIDQLAAKLHAKTLEYEQRDIERLHHLLELAAADGCYWQSLSRYFGEARPEPCGHCTWCLNGHCPIKIPERPRVVLEASVLSQVESLRREYPNALNEPQLLARFLCGVTSPKLTKAKLGAHPSFGMAAQVPFADVLAALASSREPQREAARPSDGINLTEQEIKTVHKFIQELGGFHRATQALASVGQNPEFEQHDSR